MKSYVKTMKLILLVGIIVPSLSFAQTHRAYADELFKKSDYYKAFFLYRNLYGTDLNENQFAQRCNQAMVLTKQFLDLRATKQYYDAKTKLRELLDINPDDFHAPILPQLSIEEATYWQRLASKQNSAMEVNLMLEKAIALYQQGQKDGWNHKEIDDAIKQCEASKVTSGISENATILSSTKIPAPTEIVQDSTAKVAIQITPEKEENIIEKADSTEKKLPTELKIAKTRKQNIAPRKYVASNIK
jgi:tetratricopeptide (TPR) repeat protein